jgi:hypothetical protein
MYVVFLPFHAKTAPCAGQETTCPAGLSKKGEKKGAKTDRESKKQKDWRSLDRQFS